MPVLETASLLAPLDAPARLLQRFFRTVTTHRQLRDLDERMLRDIGMVRMTHSAAQLREMARSWAGP